MNCKMASICYEYLQILLLIYLAELIESAMYLYRATKDPYFLEVGRDMLESIETSARTPCGYATVSTAVWACPRAWLFRFV